MVRTQNYTSAFGCGIDYTDGSHEEKETLLGSPSVFLQL